MMELGDMNGMSRIFRISRFGKSCLKRVIAILNSSKCDPKTGLPKICAADVFSYERWPSQEKRYPRHKIVFLLSQNQHTRFTSVYIFSAYKFLIISEKNGVSHDIIECTHTSLTSLNNN